MPICREFSCVFGRGCFMTTVFLGKILLAFVICHFVLQDQIWLLFQVSLCLLFLHSSPRGWKWHILGMLVLEDLVGLHRPIQLQLLQHYWLGHRLGLLWYWMVSLGNQQRLFSHFWVCIQVLHFGLFCWLWWLLHFFQGILPTVVGIMVIWVKFTHSSPFEFADSF